MGEADREFWRREVGERATGRNGERARVGGGNDGSGGATDRTYGTYMTYRSQWSAAFAGAPARPFAVSPNDGSVPEPHASREAQGS